ncbi:hypothetical protein AURDEDRAFT_120633 [Auricularia subglabra TFB-10046 SS5]|nr:hypothetical protein AURDEDRAFT_120633 [Auricularia subglabra TFB-10046 SS5]
MARVAKRKRDAVPDLAGDHGPSMAATASDAPNSAAPPAKGKKRSTRAKTKSRKKANSEPDALSDDELSPKQAAEFKAKLKNLRKTALKVLRLIDKHIHLLKMLQKLAGLHPLDGVPHPLPTGNIRRTAYNVPTPAEENEELEYGIVDGKVKATAERAPPPPAGNTRHFMWREPGDGPVTVENKLYRAWYEKKQAQFDANASRERSEAQIAEAEARVAIMQANPDKYPPIHTSTVVKDNSRDREPVVIYYACDPVAFEEKRKEMHAEGVAATDEEINNLVRDEPSSFHGLPAHVLNHFCERTQDVMAAFAPPVKDPDHTSRHRPPGLIEKAAELGKIANSTEKKRKNHHITEEEKEWAKLVHEHSYMEYELESGLSRDTGRIAEEIKAITAHGVEVPQEMFVRFKESIGVLHFVHCWHENGHRTTDHMCSSIDMLGDKASTRQGAVRAYHHNTRFLRGWLDRCFKASVPRRDYRKYNSAYQAGRIFGDDVPGPFLSQVIVWKCESHVHRDRLDGEGNWCLTFAGGGFEGGIIYFPDLWLCFRYKPGDILIFRSADLYHCVGKWTPKVMKQTDTITPGRMAFVFFSPDSTLRVLHGKPANWFVNTGGGHYEQEMEVRPRKKVRRA